MDIGDHLERSIDTLAGATRVRGTRLSVDFILGLFEQGWSEADVLDNYPQLRHESLMAVFSYARKSLRADEVISVES